MANTLTTTSREAPQQELPPYFDRPRLANRWDCSISTLKRLEKAGVLTPTRLSARTVRYSRATILMIENNRQ